MIPVSSPTAKATMIPSPVSSRAATSSGTATMGTAYSACGLIGTTTLAVRTSSSIRPPRVSSWRGLCTIEGRNWKR